MARPHSGAAVKVGQRIAEARRRATITAKVLAECADLDLTHVQRVERGEMNPTLMTLSQIAIALEVDLAQLVFGVVADDLQAGRRPVGHTTREQERRGRRPEPA